MTRNIDAITLIFPDNEFDKHEIDTLTQTVKSNVASLGIALQEFTIAFRKDHIGPAHALGVMSPLIQYGNKIFGVAVNVSNDLKQSIWAIGHELVHVRQYLHGKLRDDPWTGVSQWLDGERSVSVPLYLQTVQYKQLPWEIEAHGLQYGLFVKAMTAIGRELEAEGYDPWAEMSLEMAA